MNIRAWGFVAALFIALVFSVVDRMIIGLLVEPIKADLGLSDTQISLLQGLAFMLVYAAASVPMGLLIDRVSRTKAIAAGIAIWSVMTTFSAFAGNFLALFIARAGVGIGEAVLIPGAFALIASVVPRHRQGLALGIFFFGAGFGVTVALIAGGALAEHLQRVGGITLPFVGTLEPWRATFLLVGGPGLILALLFRLIPEPSARSAREPSVEPTRLAAFYRKNWPVLVPHHLAVGFCNMIVFASLMWVVTFLSRVHQWGIGEGGMASGTANLLGGGVGLIIGGAVSDRVARRGEIRRLWLCILLALATAVLGFAYPAVRDPILSVAIFSAMIACVMGGYGIGGATLQQLAPDEVRGSAAAVYGLIVYLFTGMGPTIIALISDGYFPEVDGIRSSLMVFTPLAAILAAVCFAISARHYHKRGIVR